jgi:hypothetical protein
MSFYQPVSILAEIYFLILVFEMKCCHDMNLEDKTERKRQVSRSYRLAVRSKAEVLDTC